MYPMNIRIAAENGLTAPFQIWKLPKVQTRLDEVMVDILYKLKDYDKDWKNTAEIISLGAVTMLKAICNVQKAILDSTRDIIDTYDFFVNKVENLRNMTICWNWKKLFWELQVPTEC